MCTKETLNGKLTFFAVSGLCRIILTIVGLILHKNHNHILKETKFARYVFVHI